MSDLISRQAVIHALEKCHKQCCREDDGGDEWIHFETTVNELECIPPAEPERKIGTWTKDASCPFCEFQPWYEGDIHTLSFCPNCGADMRGETE